MKIQDFRSVGIYVLIPIQAIIFSEILIYLGMVEEALWIQAAILIGLFFSMTQIKSREIRMTYQALMLLPLLHLLSFSIPIGFNITLYSVFLIYIPLSVMAMIAIASQNLTYEELGITFKKIWLYLPFSILLSFVLAAGDFKIIHTNFLIPDLSPLNILKLTIVMVFFVGLVEEIIFRSILQTRLNKIFGLWGGILLTSVLFGFMHSGYENLYVILYYFFTGITLGYMFYRTQSLILVTLVHGFMNVFLFGFIPHLGLGLGLL